MMYRNDKSGVDPKQKHNTDQAKTDSRRHVLRVPLRRGGGRRVILGEWDVDGEVHKLPVMVKLRERAVYADAEPS